MYMTEGLNGLGMRRLIPAGTVTTSPAPVTTTGQPTAPVPVISSILSPFTQRILTRLSPAQTQTETVTNEDRQPTGPLVKVESPSAPTRYIYPTIKPGIVRTKDTPEPIRINRPVPTTITAAAVNPIVTDADVNRTPNDMPYTPATIQTETEQTQQAAVVPGGIFGIPWGVIGGLGIITWALWQGFKGGK